MQKHIDDRRAKRFDDDPAMHFRIVQHFGKPRARYSKTFDVTRPPPSTLDFGCEIAKQLVRWDRILQPYFVTSISLLSVCVLNCEITAKKVGEDVSVVGG